MDTLLETVRAVLSTTPQRWQQLARSLSVDLLTRPPAPGEWSALDCLQHLLDAERQVFPVRVQAFLAGQDLVGFFPDEQGISEDSVPFTSSREWRRPLESALREVAGESRRSEITCDAASCLIAHTLRNSWQDASFWRKHRLS